MRIIVDFADPNNDIEFVGLEAGVEPTKALGPSGEIAWRIFSAAARMLFLVRQRSPAANEALKRELKFIEDRIREQRRSL